MKLSIWTYGIFFQLIFFCCWWFWLPGGYARMHQEQLEIELLQHQYQELLLRQQLLQEDAGRWKSDTFFVEQYARERLGMSYPSDVVLV